MKKPPRPHSISVLAGEGTEMKWVRRVLVTLIALPLLGLAALLLAGQRQGAGRAGARVEIGRPPAQVFRHLEDDKLLKRWTGVSSVEWLGGRELRPGARSRIVVESRGQRTVMEGEVTAVEKDHLLAFVLSAAPGSSVGFKQVAEYRLDPRDGGTRLSVTTDTHYDGIVLGLLEPLITAAARKQLEANLARLKTQVEATPGEVSSGS